MKIALVYPFLRRPGGIERYVRELGRVLARTDSVTYVSGESEPVTDGAGSLRVPFAPTPVALATASFSVGASMALRRSPPYDVVNVHGASGLDGDVITAHSCHKAWFLSSLATLPRFRAAWWMKLLNPVHWVTIGVETLQYRRRAARHVIAVSPSIKEELVDRYGIEPERVTVILSGVDCQAFHPHNRVRHRRAVLERHGIAPERRVLLFVGNEFSRKGLGTIIEAMASMEDPEAVLLVVGGGGSEPHRARARRLGIGDRIVFAGSVADPAPYYGAADVYVMPTAYEAFSLALLEAMASGLPVVTTAVAGAVELVRDGEDGFLLRDPRDPTALARYLDRLGDPALREAMGWSARERAEAFSWERVAEQTLEVFRRCAGP